MKPQFSGQFIKSYEDAPLHVRKSFDKQLKFLLNDLRHPSLHAKKYDEATGIWQPELPAIGDSISAFIKTSINCTILSPIPNNLR